MIEQAPLQQPFTDGKVNAPAWMQWITKLSTFACAVSDYGTTDNRPIKNLFIGRPYFDQTLGYPVYVKTVNPVVWVDGSGATV